jgi:preprotein translocase subunit SecG
VSRVSSGLVLRTALLTVFLVALMAPVALASEEGHDGGEGLWGETNDKVITNAGFILIAAFPVLVFVLSLIQGRLEKRKDHRLAAEKARRARADMRGGW